jgi:3-hydroxy-5-methyl-1-naphthoate 3-O-methyltransferase
VVISELLVNDEKTGPPPAALMSLTMLIEDEGRNYTAAEYEQWLTETGFRKPRRVPLNVPGANGLIIAEKP